MRWILRRWLLAGGARSFLAGYIGCPLLIGLVAAIVAAIAKHSVAGLLIVPVVPLVCLVAPVGLIVGMAFGIEPGWGPWDGRLVFMGLMAGLVALVIIGRWLEKRDSAPDGGDATLRVPAASVVTARRAYRFPTTTWHRFIGRLATVPWNQPLGSALLVIAGVGFFFLGCAGLLLGRQF